MDRGRAFAGPGQRALPWRPATVASSAFHESPPDQVSASVHSHGFPATPRFSVKCSPSVSTEGGSQSNNLFHASCVQPLPSPPPSPANQVQPHRSKVPDGELSDDTGHFQNLLCPSIAMPRSSQQPRQPPPTSLTMRAGWNSSTARRLRSFRAETFHGLTKPSRDSRTCRCDALFAVSFVPIRQPQTKGSARGVALRLGCPPGCPSASASTGQRRK